ncbi:hypothetical protein HK102_001782 [Quaeritorhiza haematococci]|nr:hypothetical protein HK102_001782 [Quaeritorhiza haematococci]
MTRKFAYIHMCLAATAFAARGTLAAPISSEAADSLAHSLSNTEFRSAIPHIGARSLNTPDDITSIIPESNALVTGLSERQFDVGTIINLLSQIPWGQIISGLSSLIAGAAGGEGGAGLAALAGGLGGAGGHGAALAGNHGAAPRPGGGLPPAALAAGGHGAAPRPGGGLPPAALAAAGPGAAGPARIPNAGAGAAAAGHRLLAREPQLGNIDIQSIISVFQNIPFADILKAFQQLASLAGGAGGAGGAELADLAKLVQPALAALGAGAGAGGQAHKLLVREPQQENIDPKMVIDFIQRIPKLIPNLPDFLKTLQQLRGLTVA